MKGRTLVVCKPSRNTEDAVQVRQDAALISVILLGSGQNKTTIPGDGQRSRAGWNRSRNGEVILNRTPRPVGPPAGRLRLRRGIGWAATLVCAWLYAGAATAAPPAVALIIDDLGNSRIEGLRVLELPGPVACAFLPETPFAPSLARLAFQLDKEVLLHLPMEANNEAPLGPGGITMEMPRGAVEGSVRRSLADIPYVMGVSNHMGSRLTRNPAHMEWIMGLVRHHGGLFFIDSRTTEQSVAARVARRNGLAVAERDVFLDNEIDTEAIRAQFRELIDKARTHGTALGIAHPHPVTLDVLAAELPRLRDAGIRLVPLTTLIGLRTKARQRPIEQMSASARASIAGAAGD